MTMTTLYQGVAAAPVAPGRARRKAAAKASAMLAAAVKDEMDGTEYSEPKPRRRYSLHASQKSKSSSSSNSDDDVYRDAPEPLRRTYIPKKKSSTGSAGLSYGSGIARTGGRPKVKKALGQYAASYLKNWLLSPEHIEHPYPTEEEKTRIMDDTGLELKQLTNWFVNNRKRYWRPKVDELRRKAAEEPGVSVPELAAREAEARPPLRKPDGSVVEVSTASPTNVPAAIETRKRKSTSKRTSTSKSRASKKKSKVKEVRVMVTSTEGIATADSHDQIKTANKISGRQGSSECLKEAALNAPFPSHESNRSVGKMMSRLVNARDDHLVPAAVLVDYPMPAALLGDDCQDITRRIGVEVPSGVERRLSAWNDCEVRFPRLPVSNPLAVSVVNLPPRAPLHVPAEVPSAIVSAPIRAPVFDPVPIPTVRPVAEEDDVFTAIAARQLAIEEGMDEEEMYFDFSSDFSSDEEILPGLSTGVESSESDGNQSDPQVAVGVENMEDTAADLVCGAVPHSCGDDKNSQPCALCKACRDWNLGTFCPWDLTVAEDASDLMAAVRSKVPAVAVRQVCSVVRSGKTTPPPGVGHFPTLLSGVGLFPPLITPGSVRAVASSSLDGSESTAPTRSDGSSSYQTEFGDVPLEISRVRHVDDFMNMAVDLETWE